MRYLRSLFKYYSYVMICIRMDFVKYLKNFRSKIRNLWQKYEEFSSFPVETDVTIRQKRNASLQTRRPLRLSLHEGVIINQSNGIPINTSFFTSLPRTFYPNQSYEVRKRIITDDMSFPFKRVLIISCFNQAVRPDVVATILGKYDKNVSLRDRWIPSDMPNSKKQIRVTVAQFTLEGYAKLAAVDLKNLSKSIKVLRFDEFVNVLLSAEINHPLCGRYPTRIFLSGKRSIPEKHIPTLEDEMHAIGNIEYVYFEEHIRDNHLIGVADYSFGTQAIAAKMMMDGMLLNGFGILSVDVSCGTKEKLIIQYTTRRVSKCMTTQ